jgi:hypothetical protein
MTPLEQLSSACDDHATAQSAGSKSTGLWPPARAFSRPLSGCERRSRLPFSDALGVVAPHRIVIAWRPDTSGLLGLPEQAQSSVEHGQRQDEHGEADDEHERDKHEKHEHASRLAEGRVPLQISHPLWVWDRQ